MDRLTSQLGNVGFGFLADDLNKLWTGKPLSENAKNYLLDLSEAITNDPVQLRNAILLT